MARRLLSLVAGRTSSRGGQMEWTTPEFVEVNMDTEIGRYQEDPVGL
jgi:hypothetical protein